MGGRASMHLRGFIIIGENNGAFGECKGRSCAGGDTTDGCTAWKGVIRGTVCCGRILEFQIVAVGVVVCGCRVLGCRGRNLDCQIVSVGVMIRGTKTV